MHHSQLATLFAVAGASQHALASETTGEVAQQLLEINTLAPVKLTQAMLLAAIVASCTRSSTHIVCNCLSTQQAPFLSLPRILFVVAGASQHALASETTGQVAQQLLEINTLAPIKLTQAMLPYMLKR
jgi:short-subunit dehydrogenase